MNNYTLTCCSTADMPSDYFARREIPFICFHYMINGVEYPDDLGQSMSFEEFYKKLAQGAMPTTSQVNVAEFIEFFEPFLKAGKDILHVSFSSGLSGTYESACLAAADLMEKYPDRIIKVLDSLGASSGYGLLIDALADRRDHGATLKKLYQWGEDQKLTVNHWFFSTDLSHYSRGGRISNASAFMGNLLHICPLMNVDYQGKLIPRTKIRGKNHVISQMVKKMEEHADNRKCYCGKCFISHSACYEDARAVADLVEAKFPNLQGEVMINTVGTVIGTHTGPGTVALFFFGDRRMD